MTHRVQIVLCTAFLASAVVLLSGCQRHSAASLFPDSSEAPGWSKSSEIRTFSPDHLADYIDGDAEKYRKAGVVSASTIDYKFEDHTDAIVDVYTMSAPAGAKSILDSEPAMDSKSPALGDAARLFSQSLTFRRGPYLVRLVAYQESPQISAALLELGQALEKKLPR